jgi:hypothetical protein
MDFPRHTQSRWTVQRAAQEVARCTVFILDPVESTCAGRLRHHLRELAPQLSPAVSSLRLGNRGLRRGRSSCGKALWTGDARSTPVAFRWTSAKGIQMLGGLNGGTWCVAYVASADGRVIVGWAADAAADGAACPTALSR